MTKEYLTRKKKIEGLEDSTYDTNNKVRRLNVLAVEEVINSPNKRLIRASVLDTVMHNQLIYFHNIVVKVGFPFLTDRMITNFRPILTFTPSDEIEITPQLEIPYDFSYTWQLKKDQKSGELEYVFKCRIGVNGCKDPENYMLPINVRLDFVFYNRNDYDEVQHE